MIELFLYFSPQQSSLPLDTSERYSGPPEDLKQPLWTDLRASCNTCSISGWSVYMIRWSKTPMAAPSLLTKLLMCYSCSPVTMWRIACTPHHYSK